MKALRPMIPGSTMQSMDKSRPSIGRFRNRPRDTVRNEAEPPDAADHPSGGVPSPESAAKRLLERYAPMGTRRRTILRECRRSAAIGRHLLDPRHLARKTTSACAGALATIDREIRPAQIWWQKRRELAQDSEKDPRTLSLVPRA